MLKLIKIKSIKPIGKKRVIDITVNKNHNFFLKNNILTHNSGGGNGSSAQDCLRQIIEESFEDTRFILTTNYLHKIIPPIKSRCVPMNIKFNVNDVIGRCIQILKAENIKTDKQSMTVFIDQVVKQYFPDVRSIIGILERYCISGTMTPINVSETGEINSIVENIKSLLEKKQALKIRQYCIENETLFSADYEALAGKIFDTFNGNPIEQLLISEYLWRMSTVLDKEIQFYSMILKLCEG